ncbi:hypothetical protein PGT21_005134 [Puccinia graminis f. sp. tritici]|uniref:Uncharacterized protein n=1 Tax=Puccinia graminis f. sp. tritici TaxID=56615 RepID=A0A5B0QMF9_PUCGR|nr:hypothetical protein PGT21_002639 [Puccinia graminis f. sp. tritici]KAA1110419.1 hypothetical protein PGT21_020988 [Puccinia graminis f. sp. tritici]KAA1114340.1 hypothetical protein PGT21_005134 [Puccinia graminis f. sp. tritici]
MTCHSLLLTILKLLNDLAAGDPRTNRLSFPAVDYASPPTSSAASLRIASAVEIRGQ